jgi:transposase-like protein
MEPNSLQEAILYFAEPENCREYLVARRWPDGVTCPRCGSKNVLFFEKYNRWHCREKHEAPQFTLKTGTIMEDSPIGLDKWLTAMWQIVNCKNGISSWEIHRSLKITQKTAWFMDHRIRLALQNGSFVKLGGASGECEADETFIGGKARNMHKSVRARRITGQGQHAKDKVIVMGVLERGGRVRTQIVPNQTKETLQPIVRKHVQAGAALFTDELGGYRGLHDEYVHQIIDHAVRYVDGKIHTNGMENFWSLLKRGLNGTYVSVEPFHLFRYLDEQVFRYDHRGTKEKPIKDADRFDIAVRQIVGKRLTYKELTGKAGAIQEQPF